MHSIHAIHYSFTHALCPIKMPFTGNINYIVSFCVQPDAWPFKLGLEYAIFVRQMFFFYPYFFLLFVCWFVTFGRLCDSNFFFFSNLITTIYMHKRCHLTTCGCSTLHSFHFSILYQYFCELCQLLPTLRATAKTNLHMNEIIVVRLPKHSSANRQQ